jgi:hypothetical protein
MIFLCMETPYNLRSVVLRPGPKAVSQLNDPLGRGLKATGWPFHICKEGISLEIMPSTWWAGEPTQVVIRYLHFSSN